MKTRFKFPTALILGLALICREAVAAPLPTGWRQTQSFGISAPGIVKLDLPVETLSAARPGLEDLRLYDDTGNEVAYLVERSAPAEDTYRSIFTFIPKLGRATTVITLETAFGQPIDGVMLETPAGMFIKAVDVESSDDLRTWQPLARGRVIFQQGHAEQLLVSFPAGVRRWLRLTVDDQRSRPMPFTGARIHVAAEKPVPPESRPVKITGRSESLGQTRLMLDLGAANLDAAAITVETDEPLFSRAVTLAMPEVAGDSVREKGIGRGTIYRVAVGDEPVSVNLSVPVGTTIPSRELVMMIENGDNPPVAISGLRLERRPVHLVFMARRAGTYSLLAGNPQCAAPHYDLEELAANLKHIPVTPAPFSAPAANPGFRAPEVLPGLDVNGAALDVASWRKHKTVQLSRGGAQQIELDPDVLAGAGAGFADLRLMRGSNQVPYVIQRTSFLRTIDLTATNDLTNPQLSRWIIHLPRPGLPLIRLACSSRTPLFQRDVSLFEELADERGDKYGRALGHATWIRTPDRQTAALVLPPEGTPQGGTLILETPNGDNPPIELDHFTATYPVTRVLFKAKADDRLALYYGNPGVAPPTYDLNLVAGELLAAERATATLGSEEGPGKLSESDNQSSNAAGVVFWVILTGVVIALLVIISRLLPKTP